MAFKKSAPPESKVVKINPYSIPENAMRLMCEIIGAEQDDKSGLFYEPICDVYYGKRTKNGERDEENSLKHFLEVQDLNCGVVERSINKLGLSLQTEREKNAVCFAVAGGFSSGKSSFINKITGYADLLPTGVDPVSVVCTYLTCSSKAKGISVRGQNKKGGTIQLTKDVLNAIQHANESNIYLAKVLDKLFVTIPTSLYDNVIFIDTPGYNNSDVKNKSNNTTDKETALAGVKDADFIIWLIGGEKGAVSTEDIKMLKDIDGDNPKKKIIVFNKADKMSDTKGVVNKAKETLMNHFAPENFVVMAYSSYDGKTYACSDLNCPSLENLIRILTKENSFDEVAEVKRHIGDLFAECVSDWKKEIEDLKKEHNEDIDRIKSYKERLDNHSEWASNWKDNINAVVESYANLYNAMDKYQVIALNALNRWNDFNGNVYSYMSSKFSDSGRLSDYADTSSDQRERLADEYNRLIKKNFDTYKIDWLYGGFKDGLFSYIDGAVEQVKESYERVKSWEDDTKKKLINLQQDCESLSKFSRELMDAIDFGIMSFRNSKVEESKYSEDISRIDIFEVIKDGDSNKFVKAFASGVDVMKCNKDGFSPLTLASEYGQNDMVEFLLKQGVSPRWKDKRGYNAFHTAVENHFKDICEILLEYDEGVAEELTADGEDIDALAQKKPFEKWLNEKLDR